MRRRGLALAVALSTSMVAPAPPGAADHMGPHPEEALFVTYEAFINNVSVAWRQGILGEPVLLDWDDDFYEQTPGTLVLLAPLPSDTAQAALGLPITLLIQRDPLVDAQDATEAARLNISLGNLTLYFDTWGHHTDLVLGSLYVGGLPYTGLPLSFGGKVQHRLAFQQAFTTGIAWDGRSLVNVTTFDEHAPPGSVLDLFQVDALLVGDLARDGTLQLRWASYPDRRVLLAGEGWAVNVAAMPGALHLTIHHLRVEAPPPCDPVTPCDAYMLDVEASAPLYGFTFGVPALPDLVTVDELPRKFHAALEFLVRDDLVHVVATMHAVDVGNRPNVVITWPGGTVAVDGLNDDFHVEVDYEKPAQELVQQILPLGTCVSVLVDLASGEPTSGCGHGNSPTVPKFRVYAYGGTTEHLRVIGDVSAVLHGVAVINISRLIRVDVSGDSLNQTMKFDVTVSWDSLLDLRLDAFELRSDLGPESKRLTGHFQPGADDTLKVGFLAEPYGFAGRTALARTNLWLDGDHLVENATAIEGLQLDITSNAKSKREGELAASFYPDGTADVHIDHLVGDLTLETLRGIKLLRTSWLVKKTLGVYHGTIDLGADLAEGPVPGRVNLAATYSLDIGDLDFGVGKSDHDDVFEYDLKFQGAGRDDVEVWEGSKSFTSIVIWTANVRHLEGDGDQAPLNVLSDVLDGSWSGRIQGMVNGLGRDLSELG